MKRLVGNVGKCVTVDETNGLVYFPDSEHLSHCIFKAIEVSRIHLSDLLFIDKLQATQLYQEFLMGEGAIPNTVDCPNFVLFFHCPAGMFAMRRGNHYNGSGAIYVEGFVIEPFEHFGPHPSRYV